MLFYYTVIRLCIDYLCFLIMVLGHKNDMYKGICFFQSAAGNCQICYSNRIGVNMFNILLDCGTVQTF